MGVVEWDPRRSHRAHPRPLGVQVCCLECGGGSFTLKPRGPECVAKTSRRTGRPQAHPSPSVVKVPSSLTEVDRTGAGRGGPGGRRTNSGVGSRRTLRLVLSRRQESSRNGGQVTERGARGGDSLRERLDEAVDVSLAIGAGGQNYRRVLCRVI